MGADQIKNRDLIQRLEEKLHEEIQLMQNILSYTIKEQNFLLHNDTKGIKSIKDIQDELLEKALKIREERISLTKEIAKQIFNLEKISYQEAFESLKEKEEILTSNFYSDLETLALLLQKIEDARVYNQALLEKKIQFTKELIKRVHPSGEKQTYSDKGLYKPKVKTTTATLINQEG